MYPASLGAALASPPAVIALLEYQDPGAFHEGQLVRLLCLIIVFDDSGADRLARISWQASRHDGGFDRPGRRVTGWQGLRAGALFDLLFNTIEQRGFLLLNIVARHITRLSSRALYSPPML